MVVHVSPSGAAGDAPSVGFVVSKAVGNAVVRNRVKRRLRALVADRMSTLPPGSLVVVRALPASSGVDFARLGVDLDACLGRSLSRLTPVSS